jgi:ABC-type nickel/cobalt efflux system permease component RcnA
LLGLDWAGCADLADEGADVAPLEPLVIWFINNHEVLNGPNIIDRDAGITESQPEERENQDNSSRPHTHQHSHHILTAPSHAHSINRTSTNMQNENEHNKEFTGLTFYFPNNHSV